jgi:O-antigen/teichoic acid export membrane protein
VACESNETGRSEGRKSSPRAEVKARQYLASRAFWGIADQALSSITNFGIGLFAARVLSIGDFGSFSIVFVTYTVALGLYRAVAGDPLLVRYTDGTRARQQQGIEAASGITLLVGLFAAAACAATSLIFDETLAEGIRALAIVLPGLLLQDLWRFAFFASRRGHLALANDLIWAVALALGLVLISARDHATPATLIEIWGLAGGIAAVVGAFQLGTWPRPQRAFTWLREQRDIAPRFLAEFFATFGASQATFYGIGAILGLAAVGALRGGWLLLGPLNIPLMASSLVGIPEGVRLLRGGAERLKRLSLTLSTALLALVVGWGVVLLLLPDVLGVAVLRANWFAARLVLLPLVIAFSGMAVGVGATVGLRALAAAHRSLRASVLTSVITFVGMTAAALMGGLQLATWTFAVVAWVGTGLWWHQYLEAISDVGSRSPVLGSAQPGTSPQ